MSGTTGLTLPPGALRLLAAAPHRLLFFVGAANVLLAMAWWAVWLVDARWHVIGIPQPAVPAGWLHAIVMQYQVLPSFVFGFLLTVFPRWMSQTPLRVAHYLPVGVGLLGGQALTLAGLFGSLALLQLGALLTIVGWMIGTATLVRLAHRDRWQTWHAVSCTFALGFGLLGLTMYSVFLHGSQPRLAFAALKIAPLAVLLPIYFTVCHRMIPFFASAVIPGYRVARPMWAVAALWMFALVHVWLELRHGYVWLWLPDVLLAILTGYLLACWWPRGVRMPALLRVLFIGFCWLIAFAPWVLRSGWIYLTPRADGKAG